MKYVVLVVFFLSGFFIGSCDTIICGELNDNLRRLKLNAEKEYSHQFEIDYIPCEYYEINIRVIGDSLNDGSLKALHNLLYDSVAKNGWPSFVVFDKNGTYLFNDPVNGVRYKK